MSEDKKELKSKGNALVVGGGSGIGLALVCKLLRQGYDKVIIVGKSAPKLSDISDDLKEEFKNKTDFYQFNFVNKDFDFLYKLDNINTLIITIGFGRVSSFEELTDAEIINMVMVNELSAIRLIKHFYNQINSGQQFYTCVMVSIAGYLSSPMYSVYGATKAALAKFIESVNIELSVSGSSNRILDVSPGFLKGTKFHGGTNNLSLLDNLTDTILDKLFNREIKFIPDYENVYKDVIRRYNTSPIQFGIDSYEYKVKNERINKRPAYKIGYLSGTFDLFHIGHLNLLRNAKQYCDYLIVGVHESGTWKGKETYIPLEERMEIVENIQYVDEVIVSYPEDCDAWYDFHYHYLFVGSDYKGSERFNRYEKFFKDKDVEIVYFPYTKKTSSTQLRAAS
ncbi:SDR family NAD(P)-dependent oxidoreductase [Neobacillus sp. Marseille-QA0830]